jgi:predicted DNA-binding ArsR family transcriptional regulator
MNLKKHIKVIDGVEYVPLKIANKAVEEVFEYNSKIDKEMTKVEGYLKNISKTLKTTVDNDKNST